MENITESMDTDAALWCHRATITDVIVQIILNSKKVKKEKNEDLIEMKNFTESTILIPQICCEKTTNTVQMRKKLHSFKIVSAWEKQLAMETKRIHFT